MSMLQQCESQLNAKETFLHDQRSKLSEKDKVIINQKMEIERLEKKSKTLEYKVLSPSLRTLILLFSTFDLQHFKDAFESKDMRIHFSSSHCWFLSSGRYLAKDNRHVWAGQTLTWAGAGDSGAKAAERAVREKAHGAAHAGHGDRHETQVGEGVCKSSYWQWPYYSVIFVLYIEGLHFNDLRQWSCICMFVLAH